MPGLQVTLSGLSPVMVGYSRKTGPAEPAVPETTVPETTVPETTVPETTVPETTVPETTVPETTAPAKPAKPNSSTGRDNPKTGDENHMMLWNLLGLASACGLTGAVLLRKKKNAVK